MAVTLLVLLLVALGAWTWADLREYRRFCDARESAVRMAFLRQWTVRSFLGLGCGGVVVLLAMGRSHALWAFPSDFEPVRAVVSVVAARAFGSGAAIGMVLGAAIGLIVAIVLARRRPPDVHAAPEPSDVMRPRNAAERRALMVLAANAGICEELFFRLALPLVATAATGSAWTGIVLALLVFGIMHAYQGWLGIAATTAVGALFWAIFLASGSLLPAIVAHVVWNLVALLRPTMMPGSAGNQR